ncbi:MAG: DUF4026 domain-containing protein [Lachnospiraceae bacterium]|nr:DUF4026 domain-containing protein [Lachnospiraceae bacterium]MBR4085836.1 DUF4026 domain-containing protein [Lachnospiraceae bacterium]
MGLFNFGKKKKEAIKVVEEFEIKKIKERSFMLAIPKQPEELKDIQLLQSRIENAMDFQLLQISQTEEGAPCHEIEYKGSTYKFVMYPEPFQIPQMFRIQHFFADVDVEEIEKQKMGIMVAMDYSDKALDSYHLQLKIINTIFPETLAALDYSAEKVLSGTWLSYAAKSQTPPAPRYLFTAQAVYTGKDVWLHTHGLNRCGIMELEVLGSTKDTYQNHYHVLEAMASRLIDEPDALDEEGVMYVARLCNNQPLMATWIPWQQAMGMVKKGVTGGPQDRGGDNGHDGYTGGIYVYQSPDDMDNKKYSHLSVYDNLLDKNPMFMFTNEETDRLRTLALERVSYMKKAFENGAKAVLLKVGLQVDEEHRTDTNQREHIWFELKSVAENTFTAQLTQEPYMVSGMHEGDIGTYPYEDITDWLVFTDKNRISPDDIYLFEK